MKLKIAACALLSLLALTGCASPSEIALQPVSTVCPELPVWALVPPPSQTSTQRLQSAFSGSPATTSAKSTN